MTIEKLRLKNARLAIDQLRNELNIVEEALKNAGTTSGGMQETSITALADAVRGLDVVEGGVTSAVEALKVRLKKRFKLTP